MNISLDQVQAFCHIVDHGGYGKAAEKLNKSHSALVYMIKTLEDQCGFPLFDRSQYRNSPTVQGRRVYQKCLEILSKVDELSQMCGQFNKGWEASLKIIYDGIFPFDPFLKMYKEFKNKKIPTIIQTYTAYLDEVENSFDYLKADMMISILPLEKRDMDSVFLKSFNMYLVAHKDHPIHKTHKRWTSDELKEFYFLAIRGTGKKLGLNTSEFEDSASFFLSDFLFKKEAIVKKTGFGWLPEHLIEHELKNKTLLPIKRDRSSVHKVQPILYVDKKISTQPASQLIVEFLKSV